MSSVILIQVPPLFKRYVPIGDTSVTHPPIVLLSNQPGDYALFDRIFVHTLPLKNGTSIHVDGSNLPKKPNYSISRLMKVLLDTNIIIHREAFKVSHLLIGQLFNWLTKIKADQYIHNISIDEINTHHNPDTVKSMGIKLESYSIIKTCARVDTRIQKIIDKEDLTDNDRNDSLLLNELIAGRVDYFITEDKKIHSKAVSLDIGDKVFKIGGFVEKMIADNPELPQYKVLSIQKKTFGDVDVKDEFFDSFRSDYKEFDRWFTRKFNDPVYVTYLKNMLVGFLYLKVEDKLENYSDINPTFKSKKRLKIGTFKVGLNGYRIGERFLKIAFDSARIHQVDEIYLTIFESTPEQLRLIELIEDWGFYLYGEKATPNGSERVYVRAFERTADLIHPKFSFPFVSRKARVFMVAIYPDYHTELLPDSILNNESKANFVEHEPHRNALSKVYISHAPDRDLNSGDIIVFYRTGGYHAGVVTTIGIVEKVYNPIKNLQEFTDICYKKTFFTKDQLAKYWNYRSWTKPFVVEFLYAYSLPKRPNLAKLIDLGVVADVNSAPRGFTKITWQQFIKIINASESDESIIVD